MSSEDVRRDRHVRFQSSQAPAGQPEHGCAAVRHHAAPALPQPGRGKPAGRERVARPRHAAQRCAA
ncbi:UNVERIFIED_CONTAM: hypothetical protein NCL1_03656 [Trichonephila clavipes]